VGELQTHYIYRMKTSTIPAVRVDPQLREQLQSVLAQGESLSQFVEASVRDSVAQRMVQAEFIQRGMDSLAAARRDGGYVSADTVVQRLEQRLADARKLQTS
jgi:predicted transcriptional regulator